MPNLLVEMEANVSHWMDFVKPFASFVVPTRPVALPEAESVVGIDLGLKDFAVRELGSARDAWQLVRPGASASLPPVITHR